jgi:hypothetical protein
MYLRIVRFGPIVFSNSGFECQALGQKIEAVGNRSIRRSLVGRRAVIGNMQQRIAHLTIFVLGCCELHSQNQAQL